MIESSHTYDAKSANVHEEAEMAPPQRPGAGKRDVDGYILNLIRKNPKAAMRLLLAIVELENKEESRRLRQARAGRRRGQPRL
jgi:hypothetical protein